METIKDRKVKKMGAAENTAKEIFNVEALVKDLCKALEIKPTMLAALMEVTERTLHSWVSSCADLTSTHRGTRLLLMSQIVSLASSKGLPQSALLDLFNYPINPEEEGSGCLLYYIVEDRDEDIVMDLAKQQIKNLLNLSKK